MQNNHNILPDDSRGIPRGANQSSGTSQPLPRQDLLMQMAHGQDIHHRRPPPDFHPVIGNRRQDGTISDRDAMTQDSDLNQYPQYLSQGISGDELSQLYTYHNDGYNYGGEHYWRNEMSPLQPQQHQDGTEYGGYLGQQYQPYSSDQEIHYTDHMASIAPQQSDPRSHPVDENAFSRSINNLRQQNMSLGGDGFIGYFGRNQVQQSGPNEMYNSDDFIRLNQLQQERLQNIMQNQLDASDTASYQHIQQNNDNEISHHYMSRQTQPIGSIGYQGPASSSITTSNVLAPSRHWNQTMRYPDITISPEYYNGDDNTPQRIDRQQTYPIDINVNNATASRVHHERMKAIVMLGDVKRTMDPLLSSSNGDHPKTYVAAAPETPPKKKRPPRKKPKDMPRRPFSAYNLFFSEERVRILGELRTPPKEEGKQDEDGEGGDKKAPSFPFDSNDDDPNAPCAALLKPLVKTEGTRRPHRKTHGKVSFRELAVQVGARWRALPPYERKYYQELADKDSLRHKIAMEKYKEKRRQEKQAKIKVEREEELKTQGELSTESVHDGEGDENEEDNNTHSEEEFEQRPQSAGGDKSPPPETRVS